MKTILRNFLSVIRRFQTATLLNILGLSIAFTTVIVIMMQVSYDLGFDSNQPEADNIYRIEVEFEGRNIAVLPRPLIDGFRESSPYVKAAAVADVFTGSISNYFFSLERNGHKQHYSEPILPVSADYINVFHFDMTEGSAEQINEPRTVLIPESMALKLFEGESAIHKQLTGEEESRIIGGVYKDFPVNSSTHNHIYIKIPDDENNNKWSNFNYEGYVRTDPSAPIEELLEAYVSTIDRAPMERVGLGDVRFHAVPLKKVHFNTHTEFDSVEKASMQTIWVLIAIALVILIIAAINFTNYSIALTPLRIKSVNTQKVLGASEKQLRGSF